MKYYKVFIHHHDPNSESPRPPAYKHIIIWEMSSVFKLVGAQSSSQWVKAQLMLFSVYLSGRANITHVFIVFFFFGVPGLSSDIQLSGIDEVGAPELLCSLNHHAHQHTSTSLFGKCLQTSGNTVVEPLELKHSSWCSVCVLHCMPNKLPRVRLYVPGLFSDI